MIVNVPSERLLLDNLSGIKKLVSNGTLSRHMNLTSVRLKCFKINEMKTNSRVSIRRTLFVH